MKKIHMQQALAALLASSALCSAGAAQAQDAAQAPVTETTATNPEQPLAEQAAEQDPNQLEAIVVTAQRRSEQLQDVPISITAVTAATLERAGVDDTQALSMVTPGLQLTNVRAAVVPFLRGVGTANITAGDEGATAIYVDGILNPVAAANVFALNNVERVEVLRGPQGTLFGRNAVGGLINIITRDPSPRFKGNVEIGYGNYETLFGNAYVTGPLADNVAADLAFYGYHQGEGWGHNHFLDRDQNRNREFAVRSKVKIDLTPDTTLTLAGDYALANSDIGSTRQPK
jgi:iron complex outermembrane recepter protein